MFLLTFWVEDGVFLLLFDLLSLGWLGHDFALKLRFLLLKCELLL